MPSTSEKSKSDAEGAPIEVPPTKKRSRMMEESRLEAQHQEDAGDSKPAAEKKLKAFDLSSGTVSRFLAPRHSSIRFYRRTGIGQILRPVIG